MTKQLLTLDQFCQALPEWYEASNCNEYGDGQQPWFLIRDRDRSYGGGTVRSQTTDGGTDANRGLVTGLRRSRLRDQRTPASQEQPSLRGERDMGVAAAANAKVLSQLVECAAETRR